MPRKKYTPAPAGGEKKGLPERPPRGLGKHGRQFWRDYAPEANRLGASAADVAAFLSAAEHYELATVAWALIQKEGLFRRDEHNIARRHPAAQVHRDSWAAVVKTLALFGMTPAARKFQPVGDELDEFDRYLMARHTSNEREHEW